METVTKDLGWIFTSDAAYANEDEWHAVATKLRNECPIFWLEQEGWAPLWVILKYNDIQQIHQRHDIFENTQDMFFLREAEVAALRSSTVKFCSIIHMDGQEHNKYRTITADHFSPGTLRRDFQRELTALSKQYVDRMAELGGECDFASEVAAPYPLRVILSRLGIPNEEHPNILKMVYEFAAVNDPDLGSKSGRIEAAQRIHSYFSTLMPARRKAPTDDLASVIANARIDGEPIGETEAINYYSILATAGHETTTFTMSGGLEVLLRHPKALQELRQAVINHPDDPSLLNNAVEEILRWTTPVKGFTRTATEDFHMRGTTIRKGDRVLLSWPSANRDEEFFNEPFTFDIHRPNANRHIAFGFGKHFCLGAELARMEMRTFFTELFSRIRSIEITGPVERVQSNFLSGVKRLPIGYTWRDNP